MPDLNDIICPNVYCPKMARLLRWKDYEEVKYRINRDMELARGELRQELLSKGRYDRWSRAWNEHVRNGNQVMANHCMDQMNKIQWRVEKTLKEFTPNLEGGPLGLACMEVKNKSILRRRKEVALELGLDESFFVSHFRTTEEYEKYEAEQKAAQYE